MAVCVCSRSSHHSDVAIASARGGSGACASQVSASPEKGRCQPACGKELVGMQRGRTVEPSRHKCGCPVMYHANRRPLWDTFVGGGYDSELRAMPRNQAITDHLDARLEHGVPGMFLFISLK